MGIKKYVVRQGFNLRVRDDKGNEKIFHEGDTLALEQEDGDSLHQLEYADKKDRDEASRAAITVHKTTGVGQSYVPSFDNGALAAAISNGIAEAFSRLNERLPVSAPTGTDPSDLAKT